MVSVNLASLTNYKLAQVLEDRWEHLGAAQRAVFALEERNDVPFQTILGRLAKDHPTRVAYEKMSAAVEEALYEARYRCGPMSAGTLYPVMLRQSPRYRREKPVKVAA